MLEGVAAGTVAGGVGVDWLLDGEKGGILPRPRPVTPFAPGPVETIAPCALMSATSAARVKVVVINCIVVMNLRFEYGEIGERG